LKKRIFKVLRFLLFLAVGVLLLYFAFRGIDLQKLWYEFLHAKYIWILFSILILILAHVSRAYRWTLLIEPLKYKPSIINTFYSVMVGYLANFAFPRIGEITRCGVLGRTEKIPVDKLLGTVIVERVVDLITLIIFMIILITTKFEFFSNFIKPQIFDPIAEQLKPFLQKSIFSWFILIGLPILVVVFLYLIRQKLYRWSAMRKLREIMKGIISGLKTVYKMRRKFEFIFFSFFIWFLYWMMTYVSVFALSSTSDLNLIDGLFILVIGGFAFAAPVQGGIGAFHWIVSLGLMLYGLSREEGLAFATIIHGSQSLATIIVGTISMILLISVRKKKESETESNRFKTENGHLQANTG